MLSTGLESHQLLALGCDRTKDDPLSHGCCRAQLPGREAVGTCPSLAQHQIPFAQAPLALLWAVKPICESKQGCFHLHNNALPRALGAQMFVKTPCSKHHLWPWLSCFDFSSVRVLCSEGEYRAWVEAWSCFARKAWDRSARKVQSPGLLSSCLHMLEHRALLVQTANI